MPLAGPSPSEDCAGWLRLSLDGTEYLTRLPSGPAEVAIVYLHDHPGTTVGWSYAEQLALLVPHLEERRWLGIAPLAPGSWWTDRPLSMPSGKATAERFVAEHLLARLQADHGLVAAQIAVLGIGMGGQGALRLAYRYPDRFPIAAAIAPQIDFHRLYEAGDRTLLPLYPDSEAARQDTVTLHIHPLNWPRHQWYCCDPHDYDLFDGADRLRMKLSSLGIPFDVEVDTSGASREAYCAKMLGPAFAFVAERFERERLRWNQ